MKNNFIRIERIPFGKEEKEILFVHVSNILQIKQLNKKESAENEGHKTFIQFKNPVMSLRGEEFKDIDGIFTDQEVQDMVNW